MNVGDVIDMDSLRWSRFTRLTMPRYAIESIYENTGWLLFDKSDNIFDVLNSFRSLRDVWGKHRDMKAVRILCKVAEKNSYMILAVHQFTRE